MSFGEEGVKNRRGGCGSTTKGPGAAWKREKVQGRKETGVTTREGEECFGCREREETRLGGEGR